MTGREGAQGEGSVGEPADVWSIIYSKEPGSYKKAVVQTQPTKRRQPEAKCIHSGKGHVTSPNLQRHDVICESKEEWHSDQEHHRRAVHREEPVIDLRAQNVGVRIGQLKADHQSLGPGNEQEKGRVQDVDNAQAFMDERHYPSVKVLDEGAPIPCGSTCVYHLAYL